ncbi:DVU3141 family protein [Arsukibacterium sp.]|uniref:DVU3141 family protein n=1 Tax=Arsukibacterium sp. TaxID=1977258 RepID=UPI001BD6366E|nr:DVU3141 family protein [Arsukibacterium sp.]
MQLNVQAFMQNVLPKPGAVLTGLIAATTLLSGCATTSSGPQSYSSYAKAPQFLAAEVSGQLAAARIGQQLQFSNSPWGANASAQVVNRYFSAAGKQCLQLQLNTEGSKAVVCRYDEQQWAVNRDLTVVNLPQE